MDPYTGTHRACVEDMMLSDINTMFIKATRYDKDHVFNFIEPSLYSRNTGSKYDKIFESIISASCEELDKYVSFCITRWIDWCVQFQPFGSTALRSLKIGLEESIHSTRFDSIYVTEDFRVIVSKDDVYYSHRIDLNNNLFGSLVWLR